MFHKKYPFLTQASSLVVLRIVISCMFLAHAIMRIVQGTIPIFGGFLTSVGFPKGVLLVWLITIFEIVGSILLIIGFFKKYIALALIIMLAIGLWIIHIPQGWFNGEFGTGGCEYTVTLIAGLIVVASSDKKD
jgi:putative oxidoreductase